VLGTNPFDTLKIERVSVVAIMLLWALTEIGLKPWRREPLYKLAPENIADCEIVSLTKSGFFLLGYRFGISRSKGILLTRHLFGLIRFVLTMQQSSLEF